ncbi:hypothetical protein BDY19DRAFT_942543 [Irpex rosettiformis]|uniref:Uncharacterized protein n=1 Tax=Irpex rosettiformis TaxID=378272 RepID=A0ACB8U5F4_9APHY|nr:hypothetical protein BDY19DRAFT_942543 [Irpex rosettiformis]
MGTACDGRFGRRSYGIGAEVATSLTGASYYMPTYLSNAQLTGSHIDQLLACLQQRLDTSSPIPWPTSHAIVGPDMTGCIVAASHDTVENVDKISRYRALRLLEHDLVHGHLCFIPEMDILDTVILWEEKSRLRFTVRWRVGFVTCPSQHSPHLTAPPAVYWR